MCVVRALRDDSGPVGTTAIDKRAVDSPVRIRRLGLNADVQADRTYHGGVDQAVYAYADEDARFWSDQLGRELHPGWFGENLRVTGIDVSGSRPGDRWSVGNQVVLEVTLPREPCATFARWVGGADARGWVKRFARERRPGTYLRVLRTGVVAAGDPIVVERVADVTRPTIAMMLRAR